MLCPALYAGDINKPNVLLLIVDDLRTELGRYGVKHVKSPCIDKLADSGMVFERAYCSSPVCGPSRVAMLISSRLKTAGQSTSASVRGDTPPSLDLIYLVKTKTPQMIRVKIPPADEQRKQRVADLYRIAYEGITTERFHPQPGMQCSWCQYRRECSGWCRQ